MRKKRYCAWNKHTQFDEKVLEICRYNAHLEGDDTHIFQELTTTICVFKDLFCIPVEQPNSLIIWDDWTSLDKAPHDFRIYHTMGTFPIKQIDNYF